MKIRRLPSDEWHKLADLHAQYDEPVPRMHQAEIYVAEDADGKIIGAWPIHSLKFGGLVYVDKAHRSNGVVGLIADAVAAEMNPGDSLFTVVGPNTDEERLAIENGLVPIEGKLYRKDV